MGTLFLTEKTSALGVALKAFVDKLADIEDIVHEEDPSQLLLFVTRDRPDIVVLSAKLMGDDLLPAITRIVDARPDTKILVVSTENDSRHALRVLEAGARGYLLVERTVEELQDAIDTLRRNRTYLSPGVAGIARRDKREVEAALKAAQHEQLNKENNR